jgi:myotubularin-related protein 10/11/12
MGPVVGAESDGRDLCAIVSSLVQLLCDPSTRTIVGFQSLVQKEWIALGHPFCSRLGLVAVTAIEMEQVS